MVLVITFRVHVMFKSAESVQKWIFNCRHHSQIKKTQMGIENELQFSGPKENLIPHVFKEKKWTQHLRQ